MKRREFITLLGGAAAAWPLAAHAQQAGKKMLRVGTVSALQQSSPTWAAFMRRMAELGYQEGKTFVFDLVSATSEEDYETGYRTLAARDVGEITPPATLPDGMRTKRPEALGEKWRLGPHPCVPN